MKGWFVQIVTRLGLIISVINAIQFWSVTDAIFGAKCGVRLFLVGWVE
jgi:hypothetical protein